MDRGFENLLISNFTEDGIRFLCLLFNFVVAKVGTEKNASEQVAFYKLIRIITLSKNK